MFKRAIKPVRCENNISPFCQIINTMIGQGSLVRGDLQIQGFLRVDGDLLGSVRCNERVVLGSQARMKGDIVAEEVVIAGALSGNITARLKVKILSTALVLGNITSGSLVVEKGAVLCGLFCIEELKDGLTTNDNESFNNDLQSSVAWKEIGRNTSLTTQQRYFSR